MVKNTSKRIAILSSGFYIKRRRYDKVHSLILLLPVEADKYCNQVCADISFHVNEGNTQVSCFQRWVSETGHASFNANI